MNFESARAYIPGEDYTDYLYEWARERVLAGDIEDLDNAAINQLTRGCLQAGPGNRLTVVDFSSIEARVNAWGANDTKFLDTFRAGKDPYRVLASVVFGLVYESIKKESKERDLCKRLELGCGYGMGGPKFYATSINPKMGKPVDWAAMVPLFRDRARVRWELAARGLPPPWKDEGEGGPIWAGYVCEMLVKDGWRAAHPAIVDYWYGLQDAAMSAACGEPAECGPTQWERIGDAVYCLLPSGRPLIYHGMRVETDPESGRPGLVFNTIKGRERTYGGKLCENVTQAISRDLMAEAAVRLDAAGFPIVLHVHDEIVCEVPADCAADALKEQESIMTEIPAWAEGLPLAAEGFHARFYRK